MLGKDLLIASGGRVIAAQDNCNLNLKQDTIEVCSPVSGPWRDYIPSTLGWDVQVSGLVCTPEHADELIDLLTSRQKVRLSFYDTELRIVRSGYAIPTNLPIGADIHSLANYSLTFQGCGELEKVESEVKNLHDMPELFSVSGIDFMRNENHSLVDGTGMAIDVLQFDVEAVLRVVFMCPEESEVAADHVFVVATYNGEEDMRKILTQRNSLALYGREVAHVGGKDTGMSQTDIVLLHPGHYVVLAEGHDTTPNHMLTASILSLPTE